MMVQTIEKNDCKSMMQFYEKYEDQKRKEE